MPQTIHRGIKSLIDEANAEIETVSAAEAIKAAQSDDVVIVDIRDPREIERDGRIPGAFSCTRGMLEFWIDPASPYAKPIFQQEKKFIFHCAGGMRSALAAKTAQDMGLKPVAHMGCRRPDREGRAEEGEGLKFPSSFRSANPESRANNFWIPGSRPWRAPE
jgi:rhodanese-related sulfurtransferase